jgi:membrane-bound serine protease (ClpP class)
MAQVLPVSLTGVLLIALGIVMFILEIKVVSFGMLTLGGSVCLVGGSLMLIDGPIPELRVPWGSILPTSIAIAALFALIVRLVIKARAAQVSTGIEGLYGKVGNVVVTLDPTGKVFIHGELWNASTAGEQIPEGTQVKVTSVDELTLTVEPTED